MIAVADKICDMSPTRLEILQLTLNDFRNYTNLDLNFDSRHIVITGENGSGKTNLLESLSYLSPGRGLRRASHIDVTNSAQRSHAPSVASDAKGVPSGSATNNLWSVHARIRGGCGDAAIGTGIFESSDSAIQRRVHIDTARQSSADSLLDHLRLVWLTPSMDGLFTGPSRERRRFLDRLVLALDPLHGSRVRDFEKAMKSRNQLLESPDSDSVWLESLELQMAQSAIAILFARSELIDLMQKKINESPVDSPFPSPFPQAVVQLEGWLEDKIAECSAIELEDEYKQSLFNNRARDRAAGRTLDGPHQTNLAVSHRVKDMPAHLCSTGEQKALLIGLLLSHIGLVIDTTNMIPILLLDEVAAHLDESRRSSLFDMIDNLGCQSFLTGTDSSLFSSFGKRAQHYVVSDGVVGVGSNL